MRGPTDGETETAPAAGQARQEETGTLPGAEPMDRQPLAESAAQRGMVLPGMLPPDGGLASAPDAEERLARAVSRYWAIQALQVRDFGDGIGGVSGFRQRELNRVAWDSLPPATGLAELTPDTTATTVALTARLARRGASRPVVVLSERGATRHAVIAAAGLYRWAFRAGASAEAYRSLLAALTDWLLSGSGEGGSPERFAPLADEVANGLALAWRWTGGGPPRAIILDLVGPRGARRDTLSFDAGGGAELWLPPGPYRYAAADGPERGLVAVDIGSDEWRSAAVVLAAQPGAPPAHRVSGGLRDRAWLFVVVIAALAAEWAWCRRQGLA